MRTKSSRAESSWPRRFGANRRGMAAVEFALIAPTLILLVVGVFEMALRFRAKEETTRYVHQMSDLLSREESLTTAELRSYFAASVNMMRPLQSGNGNLQLDISSIGFNANGTARVLWRRLAGTTQVANEIPVNLLELSDLAPTTNSVVRVGVRYEYVSPLTAMFGGRTTYVVEESITRPRETLIIPLDGATTQNNGAIQILN